VEEGMSPLVEETSFEDDLSMRRQEIVRSYLYIRSNCLLFVIEGKRI
jgi:hypothetical protein